MFIPRFKKFFSLDFFSSFDKKSLSCMPLFRKVSPPSSWFSSSSFCAVLVLYSTVGSGEFWVFGPFVFKSQPRSMSIASFLSTKDGSLRPILDFYLSQDFLPFTDLVDGILVFLYFSFMEILCRSADFRPLFLLNCSIISFLLRASFVWFLSSYRMSSWEPQARPQSLMSLFAQLMTLCL